MDHSFSLDLSTNNTEPFFLLERFSAGRISLFDHDPQVFVRASSPTSFLI